MNVNAVGTPWRSCAPLSSGAPDLLVCAYYLRRVALVWFWSGLCVEWFRGGKSTRKKSTRNKKVHLNEFLLTIFTGVPDSCLSCLAVSLTAGVISLIEERKALSCGRETVLLSCGRETVLEAFWETIWVRAIASQKLLRDSGESISAARHQDVSQGALGRNCSVDFAEHHGKLQIFAENCREPQNSTETHLSLVVGM